MFFLFILFSIFQSSDYKQDSIQNRKDYAKIFNFRKPGLRLSTSPPSTYTPGSLTVGLDLEELINAFRFPSFFLTYNPTCKSHIRQVQYCVSL
ncbi:hypothetical protein [Filimonas effusa]|uniref:Uncharacterized protein n=1 Tax=Filimonas effusa TaxID=2508721 RepID=A0A4Q1CZ16_9BACT|nr:hypothetical protein [Filimonas effusa]RXK80597.1 hypothetical protein ESB13_23470 [Filimonas effusa]